MSKSIIEVSKNFRHRLGFTALSLFAPKLGADLKQLYLKQTYDVPRPFTKMLRRTFRAQPIKFCEVGFGRGVNAENVVSELQIEGLVCVDPFFGEPFIDAGRVVSDWSRDADFNRRVVALKASGRVLFVKKSSDDAFGVLPCDFDAVYVDGRHDYDYVYRDIINGFRHVKPGGFVGGHDYSNYEYPDVEEAVKDVSRFLSVKPVVCGPDFWFTKGGCIF